MSGTIRSFLAVALGLAALFILTGISPGGRSDPLVLRTESVNPAPRQFLPNAFLPLAAEDGPSPSSRKGAPSTEQKRNGEYFFDQLSEGLSQFVLPLPERKEPGLLVLPDVSDSEVAIDPQGARTTQEYLQYFATHFGDIAFDNGRFGSVLADESGVVLLPFALVDKVVSGDTSPALRSSLLVFKDFLSAKIAYLKTIKVFGEAVAVSKKMVAFDKLGVDLLTKALAVLRGEDSKGNLEEFSRKIEEAALDENAALMKTLGLAVETEGPLERLLEKIAAALGLGERAYALPLAFGGRVSLVKPCPCSAGNAITIGPPRPALLFVSYAWAASPALFRWKALHPGAWWLGTYAPGYLPCLVPSFFGCPDIGGGVIPLIAGTSP